MYTPTLSHRRCSNRDLEPVSGLIFHTSGGLLDEHYAVPTSSNRHRPSIMPRLDVAYRRFHWGCFNGGNLFCLPALELQHGPPGSQAVSTRRGKAASLADTQRWDSLDGWERFMQPRSRSTRPAKHSSILCHLSTAGNRPRHRVMAPRISSSRALTHICSPSHLSFTTSQ